MKDGRTHLAHKAEHAVDLTSGALLAMTLQPADQGDTTTIHQTLEVAQTAAREVHEQGVEEVIVDKGYHSGAVLKELHAQEARSYIPEPERGRRKWQGEGKAEEQKRTYENRRRVRGEHNKRLQKLRSELTYETGGMRRVHLRGRNNILKRLLVHGAAFQSFLDPAEGSGSGQAEAVTGALFGDLYALCAPVFVALDDAADGGERMGVLCAAKYPIRCPSSTLVRRNSRDVPLSCRLKKTDYCHGLLAVALYRPANYES